MNVISQSVWKINDNIKRFSQLYLTNIGNVDVQGVDVVFWASSIDASSSKTTVISSKSFFFAIFLDFFI